MEEQMRGLSVTRSLKFNSKSPYSSSMIGITLTPQNLGLSEPRTLENMRKMLMVLSREAVFMLVLEHLREGNITESEATEIMQGYISIEEFNQLVEELKEEA